MHTKVGTSGSRSTAEAEVFPEREDVGYMERQHGESLGLGHRRLTRKSPVSHECGRFGVFEYRQPSGIWRHHGNNILAR